MGKITIILLLVYLLYYAVNIVYDLFFKKELILADNKTDDFVLGFDVVADVPTSVYQEEIEPLNAPSSFEYNEDMEEIEEQDWDKVIQDENSLNALKEKWEEEVLLESDGKTKEGQTEIDDRTDDSLQRETMKRDFKNLLDQAETNISVELNESGHKLYKSLQN